jgi:hypothetical protein
MKWASHLQFPGGGGWWLSLPPISCIVGARFALDKLPFSRVNQLRFLFVHVPLVRIDDMNQVSIVKVATITSSLVEILFLRQHFILPCQIKSNQIIKWTIWSQFKSKADLSCTIEFEEWDSDRFSLIQSVKVVQVFIKTLSIVSRNAISLISYVECWINCGTQFFAFEQFVTNQCLSIIWHFGEWRVLWCFQQDDELAGQNKNEFLRVSLRWPFMIISTKCFRCVTVIIKSKINSLNEPKGSGKGFIRKEKHRNDWTRVGEKIDRIEKMIRAMIQRKDNGFFYYPCSSAFPVWYITYPDI